MKKIGILFLMLCLISSLAACTQKKEENTTDVFLETYSGTVTERFTEENEGDLRDYLKVDIGENDIKLFTFISSTQINGADTVSVGDRVEIECESYPNSDYHPIRKITILNLEGDLTPMVMVNGELYYDTGKESTRKTHSNDMDGTITSTVDGSETPTENDQSNFGSGYGYQYVDAKTIEINKNEKWFIFEQKWVEYTFDDSEREVKFSIEYPESWKLIEQRGYDGDENRDASPSTGIQFTFFESEEEIFSIMAMRFAPFEVDESLYQSESFETETGLVGTKSTNNADGRTWVYFIFGDGQTLPQYFGAVNMSTTNYEKKKNDIEAVMKTLKILID